MKKLFLAMALIGTGISANAQKSEINEAAKAWNLYAPMQGKKPLADEIKMLSEGLAHTDKAIVHEKTKDNVQAWSMRAIIAGAISYIDTLDLNNALEKVKIAEEALVKTKELDKDKEEAANIKTTEEYLNIGLQNRSIKAYNAKDYATALAGFEQMLAKNPNDTSMYVNAGVTAKMIKKYPEAIKHFKKAIELNNKDAKTLYTEIINMNLYDLKDTTAAMSLLDEAIVKYPEDENLVSVQTDIYIQRGNIEKVKESLIKLLAKDPNKPVYNYLYGDLFYKDAMNVQDVRNKLPKTKVKEYNALNAKMAALIDQSIPYYKKALETDPKYRPALEALRGVYGFKGPAAVKDYEDIKKRLAELDAAK